MPERTARVGDGIAESSGPARQTRTAGDGLTGTEAPMLIDQVVSRENLIRAYERVVRNKGAAAVLSAAQRMVLLLGTEVPQLARCLPRRLAQRIPIT